MTPLQNSLYWREWGRVGAVCKQQGHPVPDRHSLHVQALGFDKSHLAFTNEDLDQVLAAFRAISQPANLQAQLAAQQQPRRRLVWSIMHLAPEPYWRRISEDKFGTSDLDTLDQVQLQQLLITLHARARARESRPAATAAAA